MSRVFTANVVLDVPGTGPVVYKIGEEVPDWATVGEHASQGISKAVQTEKVADVTDDPSGSEEDASDETYADWTKSVLRAEVDGRELDVAAKATKEELIAALEADDLENPED